PVDYPADGGDDGDDEEGSSEDDEDDDADMEADGDEEEEEHLAPADSVVVALPTTDQAPSAEETKPISIPALVPTPLWSDAEVARLLAISTPPSSPLSPWSSPLPQIPSPSLPLSPPSPVLSPTPPPSPIRSLGYRAAMIRIRMRSRPLDAPSLGIPPPLPISVPTSSPPLLLPSTSRREDIPEVTLPPQKRLGIALGPGYEVGESSSAAACPRPLKDTNEVYMRLDKEQSQRQLLAGRLNMLFRDRRAHARTARLIETEARMSREAWGRSMDASDLAHTEVMSLRTTVLAQM
ncbi:hypothetical protein Tco_1075716, partial [Tanacetum coccineum]